VTDYTKPAEERLKLAEHELARLMQAYECLKAYVNFNPDPYAKRALQRAEQLRGSG
jgi:hypothetical protein